MKSEIWHTLVLSNKQEIRKHIFLEMEEFQLTKMERNLTQYSCTCISKLDFVLHKKNYILKTMWTAGVNLIINFFFAAKSNNEEVKKHFASGDLLIVTLSRGRFFAFLVAIHSRKFNKFWSVSARKIFAQTRTSVKMNYLKQSQLCRSAPFFYQKNCQICLCLHSPYTDTLHI